MRAVITGVGSPAQRRALRSRSRSAPGAGYGQNLAAQLRRPPSGSLPFPARGGFQPLPGARRLSVRTLGRVARRGGSPGWVATRALSPETLASAEAGGLKLSRGGRWAIVSPRSPALRDAPFRAIFKRGRRACLTPRGSERPLRSAGQSSRCRARRRRPALRAMLGAAASNERSPRELAHSVSARRRQAGASVTDADVGDAGERGDVGFGECAVGAATAATPRPLSGGGDAAMGAAAAEADRTLFVGNLETKVTEELLFELFHQVSGWDRPFPFVFRLRKAGPQAPCSFRASWAVRTGALPVAGRPGVAPGVGDCRRVKGTLVSPRGSEDRRWWGDPR